MIQINLEKCTGCGECAKDCSYLAIKMEQGKAVYDGQRCNRCAHCVAVCPEQAVTMPSYAGMEVLERDQLHPEVDPGHLLDMIRFRRSIRRFQDRPVEPEKIKMMLQAGRFTQSGGNCQAVRYVLIQNNRPQILKMALEGLQVRAADIDLHPDAYHPREQRFARLWRQYDVEFRESGNTKDVLFFDSPLQILVIADTEMNAGLAAQSLNLMAVAQGLGVMFCGFCQMGVKHNPELQAYLGLQPTEAVYACMCVGYPDVTYLRTAPRDPVQYLQY